MADRVEHYVNNGKDLIDLWAERHSPEEFRTIIISMIEKYCSRYGKKDEALKEAKKIQDYANRLVEYEEGLSLRRSGWIKWEEKNCPPSEKNKVIVRLRNGRILKNARFVDEWCWWKLGDSKDIVAYKVVDDV